MKLSAKKTKTYDVHYHYKNETEGTVELWFSLPIETATQRNIVLVAATKPTEMTPHEFLNVQYYYRLAPQEEVTIHYRFDGYRVKLSDGEAEMVAPLSAAERRYYLRSTPLTNITATIRDEARAIVGDEQRPLQQAERIFHHLVKHYRYTTDVKERGVLAFQRQRKGDCGEFAFLFAAYCRAIGIPARTPIGAWTAGKFQPHAWSEFYVENIGWIPVDASVAKLLRNPLKQMGIVTKYGTLRKARDYFGQSEGKRIAFSCDEHVPLTPHYVDEVKREVKSYFFGERDFHWGYESFDGAAPYMQPIYLKFHSATSNSAKQLLGTWTVREPLMSEALRIMKLRGLHVGVACAILAKLHDWFLYSELTLMWINAISGLGFILFVFLSYGRREYNFVTNILLLFILLGALGTLADLTST